MNYYQPADKETYVTYMRWVDNNMMDEKYKCDTDEKGIIGRDMTIRSNKMAIEDYTVKHDRNIKK